MIQVHQTQPATAAVASWLRNLLQPAIQAALLASPMPVELRDCSDWGGWCADRDRDRDGRVAIGSRARFWSRSSVVAIYLHETGHRLLADAGAAPGHGADFMALQLVMLSRLDLAGDAVLPRAGG